MWNVCSIGWGGRTRAINISAASGKINSGEGSAPPPLAGILLGDFPLEQSFKETLRHAFNQVRVINGQQIQTIVALSQPYFSIIKDRLYCMMQDTRTDELTQLLVPKGHRELLFHVAHHNPMAGHLGQDKNTEPYHGQFVLAGHLR